MRNSRVPDIVAELKEFGINVLVHDPLADSEEVHSEHGIELSDLNSFKDLDALVLAVSHSDYVNEGSAIEDRVVKSGVIIDVKSVLSESELSSDKTYWSL